MIIGHIFNSLFFTLLFFCCVWENSAKPLGLGVWRMQLEGSSSLCIRQSIRNGLVGGLVLSDRAL